MWVSGLAVTNDGDIPVNDGDGLFLTTKVEDNLQRRDGRPRVASKARKSGDEN